MTYAPFNLAGKVCVITGGNKGIGLGMAEALAASNADVVIWGRKEDDNAAALKKLEGLGTGKASSKKVDVAEEDQIVKAMAETEEEYGRIDTCIANAGIGRGAANFHEMTLETWQFNQRINSEGAFLTLREAAKSMVKRAKAGDPGGSLARSAVGCSAQSGIWPYQGRTHRHDECHRRRIWPLSNPRKFHSAGLDRD